MIMKKVIVLLLIMAAPIFAMDKPVQPSVGQSAQEKDLAFWMEFIQDKIERFEGSDINNMIDRIYNTFELNNKLQLYTNNDQLNHVMINALAQKFNRAPLNIATILATPASSRFIKQHLISIRNEPISPDVVAFVTNFVKSKIDQFSLVPIKESLPSIKLSAFVNRIRFWLRTLNKEQILDENDEFNTFLINALAKKYRIEPQQAAAIINTPASRRFINEPKTFFSLLPLDIIKVKVGNTNFEQFDNAITRLKLIASQQPELQKKLLSDVNYNSTLIAELAKEYDLSTFEVALILNTPASLQIFKNTPLHARRDNGIEFDEYSSPDKIIYIISTHLEKMLRDKSNPNLREKANDAIRYVKRFLDHPLVKEKQVFSPRSFYSFYYSILIPIDAIERGLNNFQDRHDGNQDGNAWYRAQNVTQEYLDIAIRFAHPIAMSTIINNMVTSYTMEKTLAQAFKDKNKDAINFILDVFDNGGFQINKDTFTKYDDRFERYGDRYKITFEEFINSIIAYVQSSRDYTILDKLKKIMLAQDIKNIVTELLKYNIDQKTLTKELLHQFISLGVDLNEPDQNGQYPLIRAIKSKSSNMVAELLATGKINVQICQDGHNALWYAENTEDMNFADRRAMIELLKRAGVTEQAGEVCAIQ
jgi:hypothetical protein